jgi:ComEC/Rec2-related protein
MIDMSVAYLIVISGFHLSIFKYLINKICKHKKTSITINLVFIGFYCYLLNFSLSATRVLLCMVINLLTRKRLNKYDVLGLSGLISIFLNPSSPLNYGFCLSYLCTATIYLVYDLNISNFFIEKILVNLCAIIVSLPFVLLMSKHISIWALLFSVILSYVFIIVFIYFLFTFWIV